MFCYLIQLEQIFRKYFNFFIIYRYLKNNNYKLIFPRYTIRNGFPGFLLQKSASL